MTNDRVVIGIFDSGVGGLSVIKELYQKIPDISIEYVGDTYFVPYGPKTRERVQSISYRLIGYLVGRGAKFIVAACNTATAAIMPEAISDFKVPVMGPIYAGALEANARSKTRRIGIIATEGTIRSQAYQDYLKSMDPHIKVITQAAPGFVEAVEKGEIDHPKTTELIHQYLKIFSSKPIDTLILGCTHFPFLRGGIEAYFKDQEVQIIDPADSLARIIHEKLPNRIDSSIGVKPSYSFWATDLAKVNPELIEFFKTQFNMPFINFSQLEL